ncbi:MAG TPA: TRAP transporter substrate-binding protein [Hyphomicrobiales bacterium]|nr:TRAP transporter substrate-binding protein [Hyphomicrobiales bacterium]
MQKTSRHLLAAALAAGIALGGGAAVTAKELSLSHFMSPKHPMQPAVMEPFAEKLAEVSGGELTVKIYPGGTLNSAPPQQYSRLLEGIADIAFGLPGYTGQLFPVTNTLAVPGVCTDAVVGTERLWNAIDLVEKEYDAKIIALWANDVKVLITRGKAVKRVEDIEGMKIRVTSPDDVPFVEALGASAVSQPVTVLHQNLSNGTIDGIMIGASAIASFKLWEPAEYVTTNLPPSCAALFLLMNKEVWEGLSDQEKGWIEEASGRDLSLKGGQAYKAAGGRGLDVAKKNGVELIALSAEEAGRFNEAMQGAVEEFKSKTVRDGVTGAQVLEAMGVE